MKVLSIIFTSTYGGPHNQALRLAPVLEQHGWHTVVALSDEPGNSLARLRAGAVEVHPMPLHRPRASCDPRLHLAFLAEVAADVRRLRSLIREQAIDLVQVHGILHPQGALAAHAERRPILWQILGIMAPMPLRRVLMPFVLRYADVIMTTGREVRRVYTQVACPWGSGWCHFIHPWIRGCSGQVPPGERLHAASRASPQTRCSLEPSAISTGRRLTSTS